MSKEQAIEITQKMYDSVYSLSHNLTPENIKDEVLRIAKDSMFDNSICWDLIMQHRTNANNQLFIAGNLIHQSFCEIESWRNGEDFDRTMIELLILQIIQGIQITVRQLDKIYKFKQSDFQFQYKKRNNEIEFIVV
jgi:hypothetical protein